MPILTRLAALGGLFCLGSSFVTDFNARISETVCILSTPGASPTNSFRTAPTPTLRGPLQNSMKRKRGLQMMAGGTAQSRRSGGNRNRRSSKQRAPRSAAPRTWRIFKVELSVDQDPGKDEVGLSEALIRAVEKKLRLETGDLNEQSVVVVRKSFDARNAHKSEPKFVYTVDVTVSGKKGNRIREKPGMIEPLPTTALPGVDGFDSDTYPTLPRIVVVGSGPAGLFAALTLAEAGLKPVLLERGKPVEKRGKDIGALIARGILNPESNFCYGEGGAGTWSDGKLTTRIGRNSGEVRQVLEALVQFGAPERILIDGKPHLGTDRLVRLLRKMREYLEEKGVDIRFDTTVENVCIKDQRVTGVQLVGGEHIPADKVVLAVGHSARSLYRQLMSDGVQLEAKGFAVGFRVEHPQELINEIQYGQTWAPEVKQGQGKIPVADYRLVTDAGQGKSCYSFCMCPGGQIVPTSVDPEEVCINGMSFSKRASKWANSALVVNVHPEEIQEYGPDAGPLVGVEFQRVMEREAAKRGGGNLVVPVQRVTDFLEGKSSDYGELPSSSYRRGVKGAALHDLYPDFISDALKDALYKFDQRMPGFISPLGLLHGVETRTSAPVQINRDADSFESITVTGLYPTGEGAGYAGGIVSAAVDGMRVGHSILEALVQSKESLIAPQTAQVIP